MESNYFEYTLFKSQLSPTMWDTNIDIGVVTKILSNLVHKGYKHFQKDYKEICYGDVLYENYSNEELKVYRLTPLRTEVREKHILACGFNRQKLSLVNVPSTANPDNITYVKQLIFRITNRIYINVVCKKNQDDSIHHHIYVNYNHDSTVDPKIVDQQLGKIFSLLVAPIC